MRRFFGGRQPLCGTGVTSEMLVILKPTAFKALTADSRPGPGPLMRTSMFFTPDSAARRPACSAATCAANGVDLREPLKPLLPHVAQARALPCRSVIVTIVLLNEAWMCAIPSATFLRTFLRTRVLALAIYSLLPQVAYVAPARTIFTAALRGPLRVRAFVRVRWPRTGSPA